MPFLESWDWWWEGRYQYLPLMRLLKTTMRSLFNLFSSSLHGIPCVWLSLINFFPIYIKKEVDHIELTRTNSNKGFHFCKALVFHITLAHYFLLVTKCWTLRTVLCFTELHFWTNQREKSLEELSSPRSKCHAEDNDIITTQVIYLCSCIACSAF